MTSPALHDCLDALAQAALAVENGWQREASVHLLEASVAAAEAFPLSSPESEALGVILGVIADVTAGAHAMSITLPNWTRFAACAGANPHLFFGPEVERPHDRQVREASAIAICRQCPVRIQCLEHALSQKSQYGVAGGVGEQRRAALRNAWLKRPRRAEGRAA